jgi:hypothetical protein
MGSFPLNAASAPVGWPGGPSRKSTGFWSCCLADNREQRRGEGLPERSRYGLARRLSFN